MKKLYQIMFFLFITAVLLTSATRARASTWYLAEGCTRGTFETWILIQNPTNSTADITITFMDGDGNTALVNDTVNATSRKTYLVNTYMPEQDVSTKVESNGITIIAERAMYWDSGETAWIGGHDSVGVTSTAATWYLAEGCTAGTFQTWVLIQNPNSSTANVTVTFMNGSGDTEVLTDTVNPTSRKTYEVNSYMPNQEVSTKVLSTNGIGIIAERAMYWNSGGITWIGGHCSHGTAGSSGSLDVEIGAVTE